MACPGAELKKPDRDAAVHGTTPRKAATPGSGLFINFTQHLQVVKVLIKALQEYLWYVKAK